MIWPCRALALTDPDAVQLPFRFAYHCFQLFGHSHYLINVSLVPRLCTFVPTLFCSISFRFICSIFFSLYLRKHLFAMFAGGGKRMSRFVKIVSFRRVLGREKCWIFWSAIFFCRTSWRCSPLSSSIFIFRSPFRPTVVHLVHNSSTLPHLPIPLPSTAFLKCEQYFCVVSA